MRKYPPRYNKDIEYENKLAEVRVEEGYTIRELAAAAKTHITAITKLQSGYIAITYHSGKVKPWVERIAKILNTKLSYLFPREMCDVERGLLHIDQESDFLTGEYTKRHANGAYEILDATNALYNVLTTIRAREALFLTLYYWMDFTYDEIGNADGVTREMVRQIVAKGLRKLRHPPRSRELRGIFGIGLKK